MDNIAILLLISMQVVIVILIFKHFLTPDDNSNKQLKSELERVLSDLMGSGSSYKGKYKGRYFTISVGLFGIEPEYHVRSHIPKLHIETKLNFNDEEKTSLFKKNWVKHIQEYEPGINYKEVFNKLILECEKKELEILRQVD